MVYMYHSFLIHSSADGHLGCFFSKLCILGSYAIEHQTVLACLFLAYFVQLMYVCFCTSIIQNCCGFIVQFEVRECDTFIFAFLFQIALVIYSLLRSMGFFLFVYLFWLYHAACGILVLLPEIEPLQPAVEGEVLATGQPGKFYHYSFQLCGKCHWHFHMNFMIYIFPFMFSISFITVFHFSEYKSFTSLFRYIPRYFILSDVIINRIILLISFFSRYLLMYT